MSINLEQELQSSLSTQDMYDIISFSIEAANDNGFINSFIFNRALYLFAAIILYPSEKEKYASIISKNINEAWDKLLEDGVLEKMEKSFPVELQMLADNAENWYAEYTQYAHSARGLLDTLQTFTGDIVKSAAEQLKMASEQSNIQEVLQIADRWGMNNEVAKPEITANSHEVVDGESLLTE
jgi:hypothetical protein